MEYFFTWTYSHDTPHFLIFTICVISFAVIGIFQYIKWSSLCTSAVKQAYRRMLCGILSGFIAAWFGMSGVGFTKEFLAVAFYFWGCSCILFRQYALIFLRDLSKMPKYPYSKYHLQHVRNAKEQRVLFSLFTGYFFLTGTLILLYLP
jgi:hypothetical protein